MKVMYLKVLRDVLWEIWNLSNWWIVLSLEVQCRCLIKILSGKLYQEVKKQE